MQRVAVIGAGPSGLSALRAFQAKAEQGEPIPTVVCFERQSDWGGQWNATWRVGTDELGEPVHSSMYPNLWSNGPKECLELADYSFEEHFGRPIPSYPPRAVLADYIAGRARKAGVRSWIRFSSAVRMVRFDAATSTFSVTVHNLTEDAMYTETFDYLIVASGHFSVPHVPQVDGMETFRGRVLHAHDFRNASEFKGQRVLIVGRSYSAEDIGSQVWKFGAASVTISYRSAPMAFDALPPNWSQCPQLKRVDGSACHFLDGTSGEFDSIILCTGYVHHYPFLPDELRLRTPTSLYPRGLYRGVVWMRNPRVFYLGSQDQWYTFSHFDLMAWWARDVILGRIALPPQAQMEADTDAWAKRESTLVGDQQAVEFQGDHARALQRETDYPYFDTGAVDRLFVEFEHAKHQDFMGYRDLSHRSIITGTVAPAPCMPWRSKMDDSVAGFLHQHGHDR